MITWKWDIRDGLKRKFEAEYMCEIKVYALHGYERNFWFRKG